MHESCTMTIDATVGIDVSKDHLDVVLRREEREQPRVYANSAAGFRDLHRWLQGQDVQPQQIQVALEATGSYSDAVALFLYEHDYLVSVLNPAVLVDYRNSVNVRSKTDALDARLLARYAQELVQSGPDVLMVHGTPALIPLRQLTTTIPIVFTAVSDPVSQGFVTSVSRPGGNLTGFSNFDADIGTKWLQLLKDIVPSEVPGATNPFALSTSLVGWLTVAFLWIAAAYFLVRMRKTTTMLDEPAEQVSP